MAVWHCQGKLIAGTGICPGHMAYFDSQGARYGWFSGKAVGDFTEYSFIRPDTVTANAYNAGAVHVGKPYDATTAIDYVMFKNDDIDSSRWFYASVTNREYVSPNSTRLHFIMDWYSTFSDLLTIDASYIKRSHIKLADDWNGNVPELNNTLPEPIVVNPIMKEAPPRWQILDTYIPDIIPRKFVLFATSDSEGNIPPYHPAPPMACYYYDGGEQISNIQGEVERFVDNDFWIFGGDKSNAENIITVKWVYNGWPSTVDRRNPYLLPISKSDDGLLRADGDMVKNGKVLSYPYCYLEMRSFTGDRVTIKPQDFTPGGFLGVEMSGGMNPEAVMYFIKPDGTYVSTGVYVRLPEYPDVPITYDGYQAWSNNNGRANTLQTVVGIASIVGGMAVTATGAGAVTGLGPGMIIGGVGATTNSIGNDMVAQSSSDNIIGRAGSNFCIATGNFIPQVVMFAPTPDDIQAVDDYFQVYGYNVSTFQVPNLRVRQNWTYIQTLGANVRGSCPMEAITFTKNMLDSGTTFWNAISCDPGEYQSTNPDA